MKSKKAFVLWSGGLDSTYLIQKLLESDKELQVVTGYVELLNNVNKTVAEKRARKALIPILEKKYDKRFSDIGIIHKAEVCVHNHWSPLVQMPIWFNALIASVPKDIDTVCIGYVMNDCAISYLNELKSMFRCFSKNISSAPFPKVVFPLSKECKEDFAYKIFEELKEHVVWCENPRIKYKPEPKRKKKNVIYGGKEIESITPCGNCNSCKHSPIYQDGKELDCEKEEFVETYNKSGEPDVKKLMDGLEKDEMELERGQEFFKFYVNETEKVVYAKKNGIHPKKDDFIKKRLKRSKAAKKAIY